MTTEVRELLIRWMGIARCFKAPNGAIIAHGQDCVFYKLVSRGLKPSTRDCSCKALTCAEDLLALLDDTKSELDRLDNAAAPIYAAPCADCRCGSLCHWDDLRTPPQNAKAADWAVAADRDRLGCQRCPKCKGYRIVGVASSAPR